MAVETRPVLVDREDPRVIRTRKLLQDAFMSLLHDKGFHAISVQDIAERATVNRKTFYAHYLDKYDMFDQMAEETFHQTLYGTVSPDSPVTRANLKGLIVAVLGTFAEIHDRCRHTDRELNPLIEARAQVAIKVFLSRWLEQLPAASANTRRVQELRATQLSWVIFGAGIEWSRGARDQSADDVAQQLVEAIAGGLPLA